jgi:c-di-GMP-binding flagellar brake protein YcgR
MLFIASERAMAEKRSFKRFTLKVLEVSGKMIFASDVEVVDISIGGISIKADRRLNIGREYTLKLEDRSRTLSLNGAVVWSSLCETRAGRQGEVVPIYKAGLKFTNIPVETITELLGFIEDHKKEEIYVMGSSRLNIRFHIDDSHKSRLNFPANYRVKQISLGGMLIECAAALEIESRISMELSLHDGKTIKFMGRVASCQVFEAEGLQFYDVGIEFLDVADMDKDTLKAFVDYCAAIEASGEGPG